MEISRVVRRAPWRVLAGRLWTARARAGLVVGVLAALSGPTAHAQPSREGYMVSASAVSSLDILLREAGPGVWTIPARSATIVVDARLQGMIDDLLRRSVTFRRQWYRLGRSPRLEMRMRLVHHSPVAGSHAATDITVQPNGSIVADVAIPGGARVVEVVGHEVEHVLERLDGARVSALHAAGDQSVRRASGSYETARAVLVGRLVAREFHDRQ
jgi:hypothetical protein